jgi:hypothetical protein
VDQAARTCTCTPIGGKSVTDLGNVQLMPEVDDGLLLVPAIGSTVIVMWSAKNVPYIAQSSQLQMALLVTLGGIQLQDGSFGGLVKAPELKMQSEKDKAILDALLSVVNGAPIPEPGNGAPSAFQAALQAALAGLQSGTWDNLPNTAVTHGVSPGSV